MTSLLSQIDRFCGTKWPITSTEVFAVWKKIQPSSVLTFYDLISACSSTSALIHL